MKRIKTYLVKKDVNKPAGDGNWIVMNGYEFSRFIETEDGQRRKRNFVALDGFEVNDVDYIIECDSKAAKDFDRNRKREKRSKRIEKKYTVVSYHALTMEDESVYGEEIVADPSASVEETVLSKLSYTVLLEAINELDTVSRELIRQMYLNDKVLSLNEYGILHGISVPSAHKRKTKALQELKTILENHGYSG